MPLTRRLARKQRQTYQNPRPTVWFVLRCTITRLLELQVWDVAATMTFFLLLSVLPALIVLVSVVSLLGLADETIGTVAELIHELIPTLDTEVITTTLMAFSETSGSVLTIVISILGSMFSAGRVIAAFHRAMNTLYGTREGRNFFMMRAVVFVETIVLMVSSLALVGLIIIGGDFSRRIGGMLNLSEESVNAWNTVKWPILLLVLILLITAAYYRGPNVNLPRYRFITAGGAFTVLTLFAGLVLTGWLLENFSIFDGVLDTFYGTIYVILFLWVGAIVMIAGAAWDAEYLRAKQLAEGLPAWDRLQLSPEHTRQLEVLDYRSRFTDYVGHVVVYSVHTEEPITTLKTAQLAENKSIFAINRPRRSSSTGKPYRSVFVPEDFGDNIYEGQRVHPETGARLVYPPQRPTRSNINERRQQLQEDSSGFEERTGD
ncbi:MULTISPECIES: YihY/virulence factor BrkB family protein [Auritidibacter]|uniref:YihY/virulence factor BrkB family protein n=1 Tax=Auritidibacter TaxID=1160973 RepID=UPI000D725247|nr:YihY/virulence factor BrkB family protein [Auritidibacter sp. NML120636]PXA81053.1 YihY/virulence factor BrkB family protein [Auritidibacter sp. NML120636]